jgi:hypothetical protein
MRAPSCSSDGTSQLTATLGSWHLTRISSCSTRIAKLLAPSTTMRVAVSPSSG